MASRHTPSPAPIGVQRPVAFSGVGGSGLIIVVIVAAWALFLVPQWMHRRAAAAQHLADRVEHAETEGDLADVDIDIDMRGAGDAHAFAEPRRPQRRRRVHGRRHLVRTTAGDTREGRRLGTWRLTQVLHLRRAGSVEAAVAGAASPPRTAASRRRRVLALLAAATLITALVVTVAAIADLPVPAWVVAIPGGAMVGYLVLLAVVRPGDPRRHPLPRPHVPEVGGEAGEPEGGRFDDGRCEDGDRAVAAPAQAAPVGDLGGPGGGDAQGGEDSTWTPVPLPTPTYVTAPRARRTVRTIDLSNPGSWTAVGSTVGAARPSVLVDAGDPAATGAGNAGDEPAGHGWVEHRRAVGD